MSTVLTFRQNYTNSARNTKKRFKIQLHLKTFSAQPIQKTHLQSPQALQNKILPSITNLLCHEYSFINIAHRTSHLTYTTSSMLSDSALYLYHLTLRPPSAAFHTVAGNFSGNKKTQELVVCTTTALDIYRPNPDTGKLHKLHTQKAFANIQNVARLRVPGSTKDLLVLTSDSGNLTVAELSGSRFVPLVQEPHSKSSLRRTTPGPYLCVSPNNSAIMVAALEKEKLVYRVEAESGKVVLSSPLEASKSALTLAMCAVDTSHDSSWAAVESDFHGSLMLNYYNLDLGLNHVVQKRGMVLPNSAGLVVPLPGHVGGVLVCCDSFLIYDRADTRLVVPLPVRTGSAGSTVVCSCLHTLKKTDFFILLQTALGDLIKLTVSGTHDTGLKFHATYFDTIPVCSSIDIFKAGFLYANTVAGSNFFYQFESLGEEDASTLVSVPYEDNPSNTSKEKTFSPVGLQNLALVDILDGGPLTDGTLLQTRTADSPDPLTQLVTLQSNSLKTLTYGLPITELVSSPLPMKPTAIHTTKVSSSAENDSYLVLSSALDEKTIVLSIGEVVEEVEDSGFVTDQHTLAVQQVGKRSIAQIHTNGIRNIRHVLKDGEVVDKSHTDWFPPAGITVLQASANNEQLVVGLSNREVCYFEIDPTDDQLTEYQSRYELSGGSVTALALNLPTASERKSSFVAVGSSDSTIEVLSLLPHNCLEVLTLQALSSNCRSLLMLPVDKDTIQVHIGMENGVYARVSIDPISGKLSDTRVKYLGTKPVHLRSLRLPDLEAPGVLAISSKPWVGFFNHDKTFKIFPLTGSNITSGTSFYSEDIGTESVVGISNGDLSIFTLGTEETGGFNVNNEFVSDTVKLRYTPKKLLKDSRLDRFYVLESDFNVVSPFVGDKEVDEDYYAAFGYQKKENSWAACLQVIDHEQSSVVQTYEFGDNENAQAVCQFESEGSRYLVVSTTKDQTFLPAGYSGNALYTFSVGETLELLHKTPLDGQASAVEGFFGGKLIVTVNDQVRTYELGKKQLLRKSSTKIDYLRRVNKVRYIGGDVVVVGDAQSSLTYLRFDSIKNQFAAIVNDTVARQVTAFQNLDESTIVGGDKFGNIFVNRIPKDAAEQLQDNVLANQSDEFLGGAGARFQKMCDFYVQDIPTSFAKGSFVIGGTESVIYTGLQGSVGLLLPLATKQEVLFLTKLEIAIRKHLDMSLEEKGGSSHNLTGREHIKFRSYYNPVKNVVDGDFIELFYELEQAVRIKIAGELDRTPKDVERKLYDLRNRASF